MVLSLWQEVPSFSTISTRNMNSCTTLRWVIHMNQLTWRARGIEINLIDNTRIASRFDGIT